ncbi:MAG TPA: energy transducer TonB, partial [Candidatus Aminicenantes bacterium]|nr:energy transducer TonB [Candidatus Aminicenantes bacterium]
EKGRRNRELHGAMAFFGPLSLRERIERILNKEERMNGKKMRMGVVVIGSLAMALMLVASGTRFVVEAPDTGEAMDEGTPQEGSLQVTSSASIPAKHPKRIKEVAPVYPPEALAGRVQGTVILEVTTNPQGQVRALRVISGHPLFNGAAIDAVRQWTFEPTLEKGQPKSAVFPVTVPFTLPPAPPQPSGATEKQP